MILWLTGNSGSGKTTLANKIKDTFYNWINLDGDDIRDSISIDLSLSKNDRIENNIRVALLSKSLHEQGTNIVISSIAPYQSGRDLVDKIIDVKWIYLDGGKDGVEYPYEVGNYDRFVDIESLNLNNVYLLGLPRSGTSMTTHILELLGVNMIHTSEDKKEATDKRFKNKYGEYHANPNGFFEITNNQFENYLKVISKPYSGCKMIVPVNGIRWEIINKYPSKVIFMSRDVEEIRQSQMAYYKPSGVETAYLRTALVTQRVNLRKHKIDFLEVNYNELLKDKIEVISNIKEFINSDVGISSACYFVQPKQNRFKSEELVNGL